MRGWHKVCCNRGMAAFLRSMLGVGWALLAAQACGGTSGSNGNAAAGSAGSVSNAGSSGSVSNAGGGAGNRGGSAGNGVTSGGSTSGGSTSGGSTSGGSTSGGSTSGGSTSGGAGVSGGGGQSTDSTACQTVDDCVIATVFGHSGCCARTDCGTALNRAWVLSEPCASSDQSVDPVPTSCSQGCNLCPASHCNEPVGVLCTAGECQTVSMEGPCASDADCVLAVDYTSLQGACCSCTEVVSKAFEAADSCVELDGAAKPANCALVGGSCATVDCAACAKPKPTCSAGRCVPG